MHGSCTYQVHQRHSEVKSSMGSTQLQHISQLVAEPAVSRDPYQTLTPEVALLLVLLLRQENSLKSNGFVLQRVAKTLLRNTVSSFSK